MQPPDLARGIALVNEGDFSAAVVTLAAALRAFETQTGSERQRAQAELYLGIAYLELDQEVMARTRFRAALRLDPGMRLDPEQFSPQVLRTFEASRGDTVATPSAKASPGPQQAPAQARVESQKKKKVLPFILIGGGATIAGVAVAAGSGGPETPGSSSTTTLPGITTTTSSTTTTTTPPTTNPPSTTTTVPAPPPPPPATCSYDATSDPHTLPAAGGNAACQVRTGSNCQWTAELDKGEEFVTLTGGTSGPGNGAVAFRFTANTTNNSREARIRLRNTTTATDARCEFEQPPQSGLAPGQALVWTGSLDIDGGRGQVVVDGAAGVFQERVGRHSLVTGSGIHRIEATLVSGAGRPGIWRFELAGSFEPGSLRPIAGDVLSITPQAIDFRLSGRTGERVVFGFRTAR